MVLDHTKVVYTAEDEQGFTFRQINDEDAAVELTFTITDLLVPFTFTELRTKDR